MENFPLPSSLARHTPGSILRQSRRGRAYNIRPFKPADEKLVADFFSRLSSSTLLRRYFVGYNNLSEAAIEMEISRLNQGCKDNASVLVATAYTEGQEEVIGLGEMIPLKNLYQTAEIALTIRDDYQGEGLGSALTGQLVREAVKKGIATLQAETMAYNRPMLKIWTKLGFAHSFHTSQSITTMFVRLDNQLGNQENLLKGA